MENLQLTKGILFPNKWMESLSEDFNYVNVIRMIFVSHGHTHPVITSALNCVFKYVFCLKIVHKPALKQIGFWLLS